MSPEQSAHAFARVLRLGMDIILGVLAGCVLALIVTNLLLYAEGKSVYTTMNGWSTTMKAGKPGQFSPPAGPHGR